MNKELKAKWVAALRSGKYGQCQGVLRDFDGYCCLGVLREIIAPRSTDSDDDWAALSHDMSEMAGLRRYGIGPNNEQETLAAMNDEGKSFDEIADYIEKHL